jgi:hypothetical protein
MVKIALVKKTRNIVAKQDHRATSRRDLQALKDFQQDLGFFCSLAGSYSGVRECLTISALLSVPRRLPFGIEHREMASVLEMFEFGTGMELEVDSVISWATSDLI